MFMDLAYYPGPDSEVPDKPFVPGLGGVFITDSSGFSQNIGTLSGIRYDYMPSVDLKSMLKVQVN